MGLVHHMCSKSTVSEPDASTKKLPQGDSDCLRFERRHHMTQMDTDLSTKRENCIH